MKKAYSFALIILIGVLPLAACNKKSNQAPTPASSSVSASGAPSAPQLAPAAQTAPAPVPPPIPQNYSGEWSGRSQEGLPIQISIDGTTVTQVIANYSGKNGTCSFSGGFSADAPAPLSGNTFTVIGKREGVQFTVNGTLSSPTEASGTIVWSGESDRCGPIDFKHTWTAKK